MIRRIPSQLGRWSGPFLGNYSGDLWKTFNIDLDRNEGLVSLSPRMRMSVDTAKITDFNSPAVAFLRSDADCIDRYWGLLHQGKMIKTDSVAAGSASITDSWSNDAIASSPTVNLDMTIHGNDSRNDSGRNKIFVTRDTGDISVLNDTGDNAWTASWWVTKQGQPALNSRYHILPIEYVPFRKISVVGDGNLIHTISRPSDTQNDTVSYARLILPKTLIANHIVVTANRVWILCLHRYDGDGAVIEWDGFSQTYNQLHRIPNLGPITGVNFREIPIVINAKGEFLEFTGNGFAPMLRNGIQIAFPYAQELSNAIAGGIDNNLTLRIYPRGMTVGKNSLVYINTMSPFLDAPSSNGGIWCLNPVTGRLYNKSSLTSNDTTSFGHQVPAFPGALYYSGSTAATSVSLLSGGGIYPDDGAGGTRRYGLWVDQLLSPGVGHNHGYLVTEFINAEQIREVWDSLWLRLQKFRTAESKIVVKAKGVTHLRTASYDEVLNTNFAVGVTWTSTSTFTVTLFSGDDALAVGDEIEVLSGVNAGFLAHITQISGNHTAIQTITIDETVAVGSGTSRVAFDRWKKLAVITDTSKYEFKTPIGIDSSFIQFKIEFRGFPIDIDLSDLVIVSKNSINLDI